MTVAVDLTGLTVADVDDLFRRVAAGEDPTRLLAEAERRRRVHLLATLDGNPTPPSFSFAGVRHV